SRRNGLVRGDAAQRLRLRLDQAQPVLKLCDAEVELVPLVTRDETELPEDAVDRRARLLPHAHGVATPARRRLLDPPADLVAAHPAARRERVGELVRPLRRQRNRADERKQEALNGL